MRLKLLKASNENATASEKKGIGCVERNGIKSGEQITKNTNSRKNDGIHNVCADF